MRIVEPHKLVFKQSNWYLYAFCRNKNSFRLFKLRRILSYQILEEQFDFKEIGHIDFEENYGSGLFSHHDTDGAFLVILEYDTEDEFILTEKIDASFFLRQTNKHPFPKSDFIPLTYLLQRILSLVYWIKYE